MQAKQRYTALLLLLLLLGLVYMWGRAGRRGRGQHRKHRKSYLAGQEARGLVLLPPGGKQGQVVDSPHCTMETCFNFTLCEGRPFRVYVYPLEDTVPPSSSYMKILSALQESPYYTTNSSLACLFVLALDTLDRDPLSQDFVRNMPARLEKLGTWRKGQNHLVFNLYSGTWPDYVETLSFDIGLALLAKASMSVDNYRPGFDISLPLFHRHHPARGGAPGTATDNIFPVTNKHFLAFKGKRYVHGIGSDVRNSLHHLHNGRDVVMVTTCKHGKNWREMMDERCEEDNAEYDRWDYESLLSNSTFCLVPRGRRLGSFRFLETLQAGCLPVILSNGWQLPLAELVDWRRAVVIVDERQLLQVSEVLHGLTRPQVFAMRQQTQVLWDRYLSSVQKIVDTTLEIVLQRVHPHLASARSKWNCHPGSLLREDHTTSLLTSKETPTFTAIISASSSLVITSSSPIFRLIAALSETSSVAAITVLWSSPLAPPPLADWATMGGFPPSTPLTILPFPPSNKSSRFQAAAAATTAAVLCLDDDVTLAAAEIDFAFEVWLHFPDRIVGFPARSHYWHDERHTWVYSSKWSNEYSIVLTNAAFLHRRLASLYLTSLPPVLSSELEPVCEHLLINFLVAHVTKLAPVKVTQRKRYREARSQEQLEVEWERLQVCVNVFTAGFGYMPLVKSQVRLDPLLFKDPVSNLRKKYRKIELVQ